MRSLLFFTLVLGLITNGTKAQSVSGYPDFNKNYTDSELQKYKSRFTSTNDSLGLAYTYANLSKTQTGDYKTELENFKNLLKFMPVIERYSQKDYYQCMLLVIQFFYMNQDFYSIERAIDMCNKIISYSQRTENANLQFGAYLFKTYFLATTTVNKSAIYGYFKRIEQLSSGSEVKKMYYYTAFANFLVQEKRYDEAISFFQKAYRQNQKIISINNREVILLFLGHVYRKKKEYRKALLYLNNANRMLQNGTKTIINNQTNLIELRRWAYKELALTYQALGNARWAAFHWTRYDQQITMLDSVKLAFGDFNSLHIALIERELEQENNTYKLKQRIAREESQHRITQLIASVLIALLVILFLIFVYWQRERGLIVQKKIALLQGQEREREEIAKELHDNVGNILVGIKSQIPLTTSNYHQLIHWLDEAYFSIRTLSHSLHTGVLHQEGLLHACHDFIDLIDREHKINLRVHGQPHQLPLFTSTMAFRIIQEVVTNALRHAKATNILLTLLFTESNLLITVEDDGVGFDPAAPASGLGLRSIKERVHILNGQIAIDSTAEEGTNVLITLPLRY